MVLRHYQQVANAGFTHAAPPPLIFDTTACDFGLGRVRVGFASDATAYSEPHPTRSDSLCPARWITFPVYKATTRGGCCDASRVATSEPHCGISIYYNLTRYVRPARPQVGRPGERSPHRARPEGTRLTGGWFPNIRGLRLVRRALHPARTPAASGLLRALEPSKDQSAVGRFEGGAVVVVRGLV